MKCPHCTIAFHGNWQESNLYRNQSVIRNWRYRTASCPECSRLIIEIQHIIQSRPVDPWMPVYPAVTSRGPVPADVPTDIARDYSEACSVLPLSPKASAALSRRCLQNILHANGYIDKDLSREIDRLLSEPDTTKAIPSTLRAVVDGIRNFGNFSAHPINDITTLQIIDVEPEEAEWCLEILEEMFDHFYVRPALAAARKAELDAKLIAAGKPPSKGGPPLLPPPGGAP